jgi:hypothetical protein
MNEREKMIFELRDTMDKERREYFSKEEKVNRDILELRSQLSEAT